ncbi:MmcQ/YjbR family DNA-binding protein [Candidatus Binatia bacterium]|nr:MmcQ/YjbR family DNA-binding protein [Candidatus Binatia bacterium]
MSARTPTKATVKKKSTTPANKAAPAKKRTVAKTTSPAPAHGSYARARPALQKKSTTPLARLREACFSLPEVTEKEAWGEPTFRVRDKLFAMFATDHHHDGNIAVWCKAAMGMQEVLIDADPERFFKPPYVGPKGWIGIRLDGKVDWDEVHALLAESWRMTAPPKLAATLPAPSDD